MQMTGFWTSFPRKAWFLGFLPLLLLAAACTSGNGTPFPIDQHGNNNIPALSVAEAREMVDRGEAVLVDTRSAAAFESGRLAGAVLAPLPEIAANPNLASIRQIPEDKVMILYCSCPDEHTSGDAGEILVANGYSEDRVRVLRGGIVAWMQAGYPME